VTRAVAWFDCEVVRHLDMETNYELYIGVVHAAGLGTPPAQRLNAALTMTRNGETRAPRARLPLDRSGAAESPVERTRSKPAAAMQSNATPSKKPASRSRA
jgi:hypothetical protein